MSESTKPTVTDVAPTGATVKTQTNAPAPAQFLMPGGRFGRYRCSNEKCKKEFVTSSTAKEINVKCCDGEKPVKHTRIK